MGEKDKKADYLLIFGEYPHSLMQHILALMHSKEKKEDWLLDDEFLQAFEQQYPNYIQEIKELNTAKKYDIFRGFIEQNKGRGWERRVFIQASLRKLLNVLRECEAAELLESLMWIFEWKIAVKMERDWEVSEADKADFHSFEKSGHQILDFETKKHLETREKNRYMEPEEDGVLSVLPKEDEISYDELENENFLSGRPAEAERKGRKKSLQRQGTENQTEENSLGLILKIPALSKEEYEIMLKRSPVKYKTQMNLSMLKQAKLAKRGNASSQAELGRFYAQEDSGHTDYFEAARWYSFAVGKGSDKAKFELGRLFDSGKLFAGEEYFELFHEEGGAVDLGKYAAGYFRELAKKGYPAAQYIMGMKYFLGDGVEKNRDKALVWLEKAAEQGHEEARKFLGELFVKDWRK